MTDSMDQHRDPRLDQALDAIRTSLRRPPEEHIAQRHLAAMRHAPGDEPQVVRRPSWKPRWVAAGVAAFLGFTAGLGAADVLPNPAQHLVAQLVGHVGVDLPDPDGEAEGLTKDHGNKGEAHTEGDDEVDDEVGGESHDPNHGDEVKAVANKNLAEGDPLEGCEHGQAVRDVASSKNHANADAPGHSADHDPCTEDGDGPEITVEDDEDGDGPGDESGHGLGDEDGDGPGNSSGAGNSESVGSGPPS